MLAISLTLLFAAIAAIVFIARLQTRSSLSEGQTSRNISGEDLRPLFAPDGDNPRSLGARAENQRAAEAKEEERFEAEKRLANFYEFRQTWRESPERANTIELLFRASGMGNGEVYVETVDEILHRRPDTLSRQDLAKLIESHFWLLPQNERTPGVTFTIKRDVAALRAGSHTKSEEEASDARN